MPSQKQNSHKWKHQILMYDKTKNLPSDPTQITEKHKSRKWTVTSTGNQDNKVTPHIETETIRSGNGQFQNLGFIDEVIGPACTRFHNS